MELIQLNFVTDHETDSLVQQSLSTEFNNVTLITVAHRLQTIMNSVGLLHLDLATSTLTSTII